jgi:hypothetical protein
MANSLLLKIRFLERIGHTALALLRYQTPDLEGRNHNAPAQQGSPYRVMCKRLPNREAFTVDHHTNQPVASPLEIAYRRVFELSVTV